ncbi:phosphatase PAP2 family protein [Amycolatopsis endophytica]|uniref:Undecaprenyl-diphosphatase n=1 Tax=Amycolatopsis endophytica TaxID=860233 RepID=A0A853AZ51_9PSEU|nr:phosphatase PAP2 family protein [Amycolatopsis endophytica]NYI87919.1 undecaprenyl-diphosphatase [Amycolatopsis endophytica]
MNTSTPPPAIPLALRLPLAAVAFAAAAVSVVFAVLFAGDRTGTGLDRSAYDALKGSVDGDGFGYDVSWTIGTAGDPLWAGGLVVILAAICFALERRRLALLSLAGPALTGVVTTVAKPLVERVINGDHLSYPSGHTALLTSLGIVVGLLLTDLFRLGRARGLPLVLGLALLCGAAMSWSQTASRVHYLTDTIGGFCSAVTLVIATGLVIDRLADRVKVKG